MYQEILVAATLPCLSAASLLLTFFVFLFSSLCFVWFRPSLSFPAFLHNSLPFHHLNLYPQAFPESSFSFAQAWRGNIIFRTLVRLLVSSECLTIAIKNTVRGRGKGSNEDIFYAAYILEQAKHECTIQVSMQLNVMAIS